VDRRLGGNRFLATKESPLHSNFKQPVLDDGGHDTVLTDIPDVARANVWPGVMARSRRNAFIERWTGREWELRARLAEVDGRLIRHARYFTLQLAESHLTRRLFGQILGRIERLATHPT